MASNAFDSYDAIDAVRELQRNYEACRDELIEVRSALSRTRGEFQEFRGKVAVANSDLPRPTRAKFLRYGENARFSTADGVETSVMGEDVAIFINGVTHVIPAAKAREVALGLLAADAVTKVR